jgi:antitoxin FitA
MAQLLVRDVPQDVVEALKRRAAEHGQSAEAEHRIILEESLRAGRAGFRKRAAALREETQAVSQSRRKNSFGRIVTSDDNRHRRFRRRYMGAQRNFALAMSTPALAGSVRPLGG